MIEGLFVCKFYPPTKAQIDYQNEVLRTLKIEREYYKRHPDEYQEKLNKIKGTNK